MATTKQLHRTHELAARIINNHLDQIEWFDEIFEQTDNKEIEALAASCGASVVRHETMSSEEEDSARAEILQALPERLRGVFGRLEDHTNAKGFARERACFALGVELGRSIRRGDS